MICNVSVLLLLLHSYFILFIKKENRLQVHSYAQCTKPTRVYIFAYHVKIQMKGEDIKLTH